MIRRLPRTAPLVLACALLAACGGGSETASEGEGATGEVLPGSISDSMPPLYRMRSQPPSEDPEALEGDEGGNGGASANAAEAPAADSDTPASADEPAAEPEDGETPTDALDAIGE